MVIKEVIMKYFMEFVEFIETVNEVVCLEERKGAFCKPCLPVTIGEIFETFLKSWNSFLQQFDTFNRQG